MMFPRCIVAIACSFVWHFAHATTFQVESTADLPDLTADDGVCLASNGHCTLRAAIQQANATPGFDTILIPQGDYRLDLENASGEDQATLGDLDIREPVALLGTPIPGLQAGIGPFIGGVSSFGSQFDRIFDIDTGDVNTPVIIEHLMIGFGSTDSVLGGGGMLVHAGSAVNMRDVMFYANFANTRGTALAVYGRTMLHDARIVDNHEFSPLPTTNVFGTIYVGGNAILAIDNVAIDSNTSEIGGALAAVDDAVVTIRRTTIAGNSARRNGDGAMLLAGFGGSLYLAGRAQVDVENATFYQNTGIHADLTPYNSVVVRDDAQLTLRHCSVQDRSLDVLDGGTPAIHISDSLVFSHLLPTQACSGQIISGGGNWLSPSDACPMVLAATDHDAIDIAAEMVPLMIPGGEGGAPTGGVLHQVLVPIGLAMLDQASAATCPISDEIGATRPAPSAPGRPRGCDAGALELPLDHVFVDGFE